MKKRSVEDRFWEKVGPHTDPNVCWLWIAGTVKNGPCGHLRYGTFGFITRRYTRIVSPMRCTIMLPYLKA